MTDIQSQTVDVNTDDLDSFTKLMTGEATPSEQTDPEPETPPADADAHEEVDPPETPDGDETPDDEPEDKPKLTGKGKKTAAERISELTARAKQAERAAEELERRLAALETKDTPAQTPTPKQAALDPDAPKPDDTLEDGTEKYALGEFDPAYIADLVKFMNQKERDADAEAKEQERLENAKKEHFERISTEWEGKLQKAEEAHPDLREKAAELEETFVDLDPEYGVYLAETIMSLDAGPEVLYYLANNLDEAEKIVKSGATRATIALGRLEARFLAEAEAAERAPTPSRAPDPAPVINKGAGGGRVPFRADTDDLDAFTREFAKIKR